MIIYYRPSSRSGSAGIQTNMSEMWQIMGLVGQDRLVQENKAINLNRKD